MKKMFGVLIVLSCIGSVCFAQEDANKPPAPPVEASAVVDAGNKTCPVSDKRVSGMDYYEYNGKRYGMCCPMCSSTFEADPKKYSDIAEKELAGK